MQLGQARNQQGHVRLARRPEVGLDAQMNLQILAFEPASAALRQMGRFRSLAYPQDPPVESSGQILAARRHCQLHMFDTRYTHCPCSDPVRPRYRPGPSIYHRGCEHGWPHAAALLLPRDAF